MFIDQDVYDAILIKSSVSTVCKSIFLVAVFHLQQSSIYKVSIYIYFFKQERINNLLNLYTLANNIYSNTNVLQIRWIDIFLI